ncbi:MAG: hypothetical protein KAS53_09095 [Candidatus Cloacimonetes bacterium]|nr:hypothetical protein [Candidatus Cloacimonadota bacterium]
MRYKGFYLIIILAAIFIIFIIFPNLSFYRHYVNYKQFNIYSDIEIHEAIYNILDNVEEKLKTSEIYTDDLSYKIFISSGFKPYSIFCPSLKDAFAATYPIINNIFISKTDIENNLVQRNADEDNERSLSSVITHEATHKLIEKEIGIKANRRLEIWKKEGYCEYVSVESALNLKAGIKKVYKGSNSFSPAFSYLKYRIFVTYLIDIKGNSFQSLIKIEYDIKHLEKELMNYSNKYY